MSVLLLSSCTLAVDEFDGSTVLFSDLPKEVQDTILYWVENNMASDDTTQICVEPDIICFDDQYTLEIENFVFGGPWIKNKILTRISDGKEYKLTRNILEPVIVRNDTLIVPDEYNILTVWDSSTTFKAYKLR